MSSSGHDLDQTEVATAEEVAILARLAGLQVLAERLPAIADRLRQMFSLASDLNDLDVDGADPAARYDARWDEGTSP